MIEEQIIEEQAKALDKLEREIVKPFTDLWEKNDGKIPVAIMNKWRELVAHMIKLQKREHLRNVSSDACPDRSRRRERAKYNKIMDGLRALLASTK